MFRFLSLSILNFDQFFLHFFYALFKRLLINDIFIVLEIGENYEALAEITRKLVVLINQDV